MSPSQSFRSTSRSMSGRTSVFKDSLPTDLTSVMNAWSSGVSMLSSISSIQFSSQLTDSVQTGNHLVEETPDQSLLSPPAQRDDSCESSMEHGGELKDPDPDSAAGHPSKEVLTEKMFFPMKSMKSTRFLFLIPTLRQHMYKTTVRLNLRRRSHRHFP